MTGQEEPVMATPTVIRPEVERGQSRQRYVAAAAASDPCTVVIFGGTGALASRKLLPALYGLWRGKLLPDRFAIVGLGRREKSDAAYREEIKSAVSTFRRDAPEGADSWDEFLPRIFYQQADFTTAAG